MIVDQIAHNMALVIAANRWALADARRIREGLNGAGYTPEEIHRYLQDAIAKARSRPLPESWRQ